MKMSFGKLALAASAASLAMVGAASAQDWSYGGDSGPERWGDLADNYAVCSAGHQQSPINLTGAIEAEGIMPAIAWTAADSVKLSNDGLNFKADTPGAGALILNGVQYDLLQFHFHADSEHTVDGEAYPLEVHFVHASADGNLAVVGVFYEAGDENDQLNQIWSAIPEAGGESMLDGALDLNAFLPDDMDGYRYAGSLTTPPCSEVVAWTVLAEPLEASQAQIDAYRGLFSDTARPVQPLERRFVLESD